MQFHQRNALRALRSIQAYLEKNKDRLADVNATGTKTALDSVVEKLEALGDQQDPTRFQRESEIQAGNSARFELRETHMRPITRVATLALLDLQGKPEFSKLRLPHRSFDLISLASWGREMAKAAEPHSATFVAHGLPADFIDKLKAATEDVQKAADVRSVATGGRIGATRDVHRQVRKAVGIIGVLDAFVMPRVRGDAQLEGAWAVAKRIARRAVKSAVEATTPPVAESGTGSTTTAASAETAGQTAAQTAAQTTAQTAAQTAPSSDANKNSGGSNTTT
jgi:hypothetical protein